MCVPTLCDVSHAAKLVGPQTRHRKPVRVSTAPGAGLLMGSRPLLTDEIVERRVRVLLSGSARFSRVWRFRAFLAAQQRVGACVSVWM